jgi:hypothetical protein
MLDYIYGHDETVARFVAQLIPACRERGFSSLALRAIGVIEDGNLIAGFVYHNWDPDAQVIEMSGAALPGKQWLTRETIKRFWRYPFIDCGCQMTLMRVDAKDERLLRQLKALNYAFIMVPRLGGRDKDTVLCLLTREAWEANKFNRRLKHHLDAAQLPLNEAA